MSFTSRYRVQTAYLLLVLFSLPSVGFSATIHYCNGHLSGLNVSIGSRCCADEEINSCSIDQNPKKGCCTKSESKDKNCCTDKPSFNQLDYDGLSYVLDSSISIPTLMYVPIPKRTSPILNHLVNFAPLYPQPPPLSGQQIRVVLGSFLC